MNTTFLAADHCVGMKSTDQQHCRVHGSPHSGLFGLAVWGAVASALAWTVAVLSRKWRQGCRQRPHDEQVRAGHRVVLRSLLSSLLLGVLVSMWSGPSWAKAYGHHDMRQLLVPAQTPGGGGSLNLAFLDHILGDLSEHAANYPPQFDSRTDMRRAQNDARTLIGMLHTAYGAAPPEGLLFRLGLLGSFGHNLDVPDAALFAQNLFRRLLNADAEHVMGNYHYGVFLAGVGRPKESLPYLNKARDKGVMPALYSIGMAQLTLGDKASALSALNSYKKRNPSDLQAEKLIEAIRTGKVNIQTEQRK